MKVRCPACGTMLVAETEVRTLNPRAPKRYITRERSQVDRGRRVRCRIAHPPFRQGRTVHETRAHRRSERMRVTTMQTTHRPLTRLLRSER